ncbi:CapA family protein [Streptomyces tagetis]|uniref:CapA family protein n=1 Tax=Streptomyces tagetis TaxID=2820809 RepID=A0A940XCJ6_9ACTN|nr:CapA family protein [Streptomyces sp. RG38]MBQ0826054.1 CapA family protein [Streptomyces sp. RG38]
MITRSRQVALALTALLAAGAACQARGHQPDARPAPPAADTGAFTLVATGDVLPHDSVLERARFDAGGTGHDFRPMLAGVRPVVAAADLALCHLDTVYGADGDHAGRPAFGSPPQMAEALAATGYDGCATASGHSLDDGAEGIARTLDALDRAGIRHAGTARTEAEAHTAGVLHAGTAQVAHLSYTTHTDGHPLPPGRPWAVGLLDEARIIEDARAARAAGADVVVVSLHWGTEWQDEPDERQAALARSLTAARSGTLPAVDLILGTHAHVPQAYEKVNGTWVVYGMGDQIAGETADDRGRRDPRANQSSLARFTFAPPGKPGERWRVTRAEFLPLLFDVDAGRVVDLNRVLDEGADVRAVRDRVRDVVLARGAARDGLVMAR